MNNIETMKQWLEALELSHPRFGVGTAIHIKAVATLRQAIEQAQQAEPVAYIRVSKTGHVMACAKTGDFFSLPHKTLLYTAPPPRQPLTDEEIKQIWLNGKDHGDDWLDVQAIARAIEAAHGIKE